MKLPDTIRRMLFTAALAVTISITSQLRAAVVEDTGFPAPLPEWKTPAQLKVWRAETTAKTLAKEAAARAAQVKAVVSSATPSGFYTGKPYMAETGSYAFKYRDYNPEMGRWTTVDPSGFPDGANNRVYAAVPTSQLDPLGLEINSVRDAIIWYNTAQGANVTLGQTIISGVKSSDGYYSQITIGMEAVIDEKLSAVDKSLSSGTISGIGSRALDYGSVLGSFSLHINYSSTWTASDWVQKHRTIESSVSLNLWINDRYDFTPNASYSDFKNLVREDIAGWIAENSYSGQGTPFWMEASFTDSIKGTGEQIE